VPSNLKGLHIIPPQTNVDFGNLFDLWKKTPADLFLNAEKQAVKETLG
jgi:hypothetical protein